VIGIMSELALNYVLDPRVVSVFQAEEVIFPLYSRNEIRDILSRRSQMGFYPGVIADDILETVVDHTEKSGDLRVGIDLLKRAGLNAENALLRAYPLRTWPARWSAPVWSTSPMP